MVAVFGKDTPQQLLNLVCQTLTVFGQRLAARLAPPPRSGGDETQAKEDANLTLLSQQATLVIVEVQAFVEGLGVAPASPLQRLTASLDLVASSLTCRARAPGPSIEE